MQQSICSLREKRQYGFDTVTLEIIPSITDLLVDVVRE